MKLEVRDLTFSYGKRTSEEKPILDKISFEIEKGDILSVIGPNGSGKTTLFKCLLGQNRVTDGDIFIDGVSINKLSTLQRAEKMAYVPQFFLNAFDYTVMDTVLMGTAVTMSPLFVPAKSQMDVAYSAIDVVGISKYADHRMSQLSGGVRQLVSIARALAQRADILIMDEPTSALDYGNQIKIMKTVSDLSEKGYTILISMHNPKAARKHSDKTLAVFDGRMKAFGLSKDIITEEFIDELYCTDLI